MILTTRSLRGRLLLGGLAVGVSFAVLFGLGATWRVNQLEDHAVRSALLSRLEVARDEVGSDGVLTADRGSPKTDLVQVIAADGRVRSSSSLAGIDPLVTVEAARRSPSGAEVRASLQQPDIDLAALGVPVKLAPEGASPGGTGVLVVAVDVEGFTTATSGLLGILAVGLGAVVVAIGALSWVLAGRALRSVTLLTERAEAAAPRDLANGLPVPPADAELARLVGALNRMLARLEVSHAKELQFAADAGHRLRTPVATLRAEAELAMRGDPDDQTEALGRIMRDADQLALVVDRMLYRMRGGRDSSEPVMPALATAAARWERQARLVGVTLILELAPTISESASCPHAVDVTEPIVDNAIRHTPAGGTVEVTARAEQGQDGPALLIDVSNTGSGVPPELAPQIFDAWVSSRDGSIAGGLGLWVARETARDVAGDVVLRENAVGCTVFSVRLPLVHEVMPARAPTPS
ncbi:MAG: integral rane sensor signal transduction histidine kinase [Aeromicrobium sp.]|nr:integral rane sensor signal transduction histidine kinase [Aeromicrobium sp.]